MICISGSEAAAASWRADVAEASATTFMAQRSVGPGVAPPLYFIALVLYGN